MPELPEVETVVRELRPRLVGRTIVSISASRRQLRRPWLPRWSRVVRGSRVASVTRRGKWIICRLHNDLHMVLHLGMTGQLTVTPSTAPRQSHTHLVFQLNANDEQLRFRDIRRFGCASLFRDSVAVEKFFDQSRLGPEPFELDPAYWRRRLAETRRCLKAVLLDQSVVAGVGNIYADEALFEARLHPALLGQRVKPMQAERLRSAIVVVLRRAIEKRGSSIRNYVGGTGREGEYQREFRVYGQNGQPCPKCRTPIVRIRLAGRSTHFCPQCQQESAANSITAAAAAK